MSKVKTFTIVKTNSRDGRTYEFTCTVADLINDFSYTLECGKSWEHEVSNSNINLNPRGIKSLVNNLNNAINNSAANGYSNYSYALKV